MNDNLSNSDTTTNKSSKSTKSQISTNTNNNKIHHNLFLIETFLLRYSDPVNSIALSDKHLLFGSMMGKVILFNIKKSQLFKLYDLSNENIVGCSLENSINGKNTHFIAIGDESVVSIQEKSNDVETNTIDNYVQKSIHTDHCNNCFPLMDKNKLLLLNLNPPSNFKEEISIKETSFSLFTYEEEDKNHDLTLEGKIKLCNYCVPFDFKNNLFLFLEHRQNNNRAICLCKFCEDNNESQIGNKTEISMIAKNFGHISFMKLINSNYLLLVRNYNKVEVYNIKNNQFNLMSSYINRDGEINAIDFCDVSENVDDENNEDIQINIILLDIEQNIIELNYKGSQTNNKSKMEINFKINMNSVKEINQELKDKGLFALDFPYFIKNSPNYVAVTTDQACFLFRKEN